MNNSIYFYLDAYKKEKCTIQTLFRNLVLNPWRIETVSHTRIYLYAAEYGTDNNAIIGSKIVKYLPSDVQSLVIEPNSSLSLEIQFENLNYLYDYTEIIHFEEFLYSKYPNFTDLELKYLQQYAHFWFIFDADDAFTQTQWLLTPSKEFLFMPAVFTSEDLAEEFLHIDSLPSPEPNKQRYTLQTNGIRLFTMLSQMPIDQIAINPFTSQKTVYFTPDFSKKLNLYL